MNIDKLFEALSEPERLRLFMLLSLWRQGAFSTLPTDDEIALWRRPYRSCRSDETYAPTPFIQAIKQYRARTNSSLLEAKRLFDQLGPHGEIMEG